MAKPDASAMLKESIRLLEIKQAEEGQILKEQLRLTYESLKPSSLFKNTLKDLTESVEVKNSLFETVISILTGYLTKKMMVSSNSSVLMKLLGAVLQFGVTSVIAQNAEAIRNYITGLIERFMHPDEEEVPEAEA
jgi:hypothetical protein